MNKVFKTIWSEALGAWVAASELCRGRAKGGGKAARAVALVIGMGLAGGAFAGVTLSDTASATNPTDIAIGPNSLAQSNTKDALAIGDTARSTADGAIAIGGGVQNKATNSIIMGNGGGSLPAASLDANSSNSVFFAPAGGSVASSANSFSFNPYGTNATSASADAINISGTVRTSQGAVAIGTKSSVVGNAGGVAIGSNASVQNANSVAIGANSVTDRDNSVSVGGGNGLVTTRVITQVSNGVQPTDAATVAQVQGVLTALGGTATFKADGTVSGPVYKVNGEDQYGVAKAISALDASVQNAVLYDGVKDSVTLGGDNGTKIQNLSAGSAPMDAVNFKQLTDAGLTVDSTGTVTNAFVAYKDKTMTKVDLGGANGTEISNVAAGSKDMDAVNLKQLKDAGITVDPSGKRFRGVWWKQQRNRR